MPFAVITAKLLDQLDRYQIVVLPNVVMLSETEIEALRRYVQNGGALFASKYTSLISHDGQRQCNFMLSDLVRGQLCG